MSRHGLSRGEERFLSWFASKCSPHGGTIETVSATVRSLVIRKMLIQLAPLEFAITGRGLEALLRKGWRPGDDADRDCKCACPCHYIDVKHETLCCDENERS